MRKLIILITAFYFLFPIKSIAQTSKQKAETAFLKELNSILKTSDVQHWKYNGSMTVDTAFTINNDGVLSVTVRYEEENGSFVKTRMEAPINKIKDILYDLYLILNFEADEVTVYETALKSNVLTEKFKTNYFHIGAPLPEDEQRQIKLQKLLDNLLRYYKN